MVPYPIPGEVGKPGGSGHVAIHRIEEPEGRRAQHFRIFLAVSAPGRGLGEAIVGEEDTGARREEAAKAAVLPGRRAPDAWTGRGGDFEIGADRQSLEEPGCEGSGFMAVAFTARDHAQKFAAARRAQAGSPPGIGDTPRSGRVGFAGRQRREPGPEPSGSGGEEAGQFALQTVKVRKKFVVAGVIGDNRYHGAIGIVAIQPIILRILLEKFVTIPGLG